LLSGDAVSDMLLYSRPSTWADLYLSRSTFDSTGQPIFIRAARLEMVYDLTPRNAVLGRRNLEVLVTRRQDDGGGPLARQSTFQP